MTTGDLGYSLCCQEARHTVLTRVNGSEKGGPNKFTGFEGEQDMELGTANGSSGPVAHMLWSLDTLQGLSQSECTKRMLAMRLTAVRSSPSAHLYYL